MAILKKLALASALFGVPYLVNGEESAPEKEDDLDVEVDAPADEKKEDKADAGPSDVLNLTKDNFEDTIKKNKFVLVNWLVLCL